MSKPPLMPVEDALDQLLGMANQQRLADSELLALDDARGRVLVSDLVATLDLPPWLQCQLTRHHRWQASSHRFCVHTQYQASPQIIAGAGLPAMKPCQPTSMPTDPPPSLASQLPQGFGGVWRATDQLST